MSQPIDFNRRVAPRIAGWSLLVAGVIGLCAAALAWGVVRQEAQRIDAEAQRQAERLRQAALAAERPREVTVEELRLRLVAPLLRQPWLPTMQAIEAVTAPPVYLLGLSIDPTSGEVRIDGEAPDFAAALAYAEALSQVDRFEQVRLRSHEPSGNLALGAPSVRFSLGARWRAL